MLAVSNNHELFYGDEKVVDLEHRDVEYEVFLYKDIINRVYQVFYVPDAHKETDEDYANFEFLGSIIVPSDPVLELMSKKKQLLFFLYGKVDQLYQHLLENYSVLEKESWSQQEEEAFLDFKSQIEYEAEIKKKKYFGGDDEENYTLFDPS